MPTKKLLKVTKSHSLTEANFDDFNLSSYRVFLNLLAKLQHYDDEKNLIPLSLSNRHCSLSAQDYAAEFGVPQNLVYGILKSAVDHLLKTSYSIVDVATDEIIKINVCAQANYKKSHGIINIEFTPNIMPHIAGLSKKFTMYHLSDLAGFDSIYTTRLYELLMQWKTTGFLKIKVSKLRFALGCTKTLKLYGDFKRYAINHAVAEINSQFDIELKFEEIRKGRPVDEITFTFKPVFMKRVFDPVRDKMRTQLIRPKRVRAQKLKSTLNVQAPLADENNLPHQVKDAKFMIPNAQHHNQQHSHPQQISFPESEIITNVLEQNPPCEADKIITNEPPLVVDTVTTTENSNPPLQKKKRFFGLF
jgi:plasmid replication initiation protein